MRKQQRTHASETFSQSKLSIYYSRQGTTTQCLIFSLRWAYTKKFNCRKKFKSSCSQVFNRIAALENVAKLAGNMTKKDFTAGVF